MFALRTLNLSHLFRLKARLLAEKLLVERRAPLKTKFANGRCVEIFWLSLAIRRRQRHQIGIRVAELLVRMRVLQDLERFDALCEFVLKAKLNLAQRHNCQDNIMNKRTIAVGDIKYAAAKSVSTSVAASKRISSVSKKRTSARSATSEHILSGKNERRVS